MVNKSPKQNQKILIAGCGYLGTAVARLHLERGDNVTGLKRHPDSINLSHPHFRKLTADLREPWVADQDYDIVYYLVAAGSYDPQSYDNAYRIGFGNLIAGLRQQNLQKLVFVSSTSVYAQDHGELVTEEATVVSESFSKEALLAGEALALNSDHKAIVARLSGIYGPTRAHLSEQVRMGLAHFTQEPLYSNRIHRDDGAAALVHLACLKNALGIYNVTDDEPVLMNDLLAWLADFHHTAINPPKDTIKGPHRTHKRLDNKKLRASGFVFKYPTYREGFLMIHDKSI